MVSDETRGTARRASCTAEFSRDTDITIHASRENLEPLESALQRSKLASSRVPPFELRYLERGHAIHFRCRGEPSVEAAIGGQSARVERALDRERRRVMEGDRAFWAPLRAELQRLRRQRRRE